MSINDECRVICDICKEKFRYEDVGGGIDSEEAPIVPPKRYMYDAGGVYPRKSDKSVSATNGTR